MSLSIGKIQQFVLDNLAELAPDPDAVVVALLAWMRARLRDGPDAEPTSADRETVNRAVRTLERRGLVRCYYTNDRGRLFKWAQLTPRALRYLDREQVARLRQTGSVPR